MMPGTMNTRSAESAIGTVRARRASAARPAVLGGAEVGLELTPARAARQPLLDLRIAPGEAIVGGDVIERCGGGGHAMRVRGR